MMIAILTCVCVAFAQVAREEPAPFDPSNATWTVGSAAASVSSLPAGDWLPSLEGAIVRSADNGGEVRVQIRREWEMDLRDLRLRLTSEGATVQLVEVTDVRTGDLTDMGGSVCLVTDGQSAAAEFEFYAIRGDYISYPYFGRIQLAGVSLELTRAWFARAKDVGTKTFDRFAHSSNVASGYLDDIGRHQGVWIVRGTEQARTEINWRDGVPHGTVLGWDAKGRLRSLRSYRDGFEDGESRDWNDDGVLQSAWSTSRGVEDPRLRYYPSGRKEYETRSARGFSPMTFHWSEDGKLLEGTEEAYRAFLVPQPVNADQERLMAAVSALHTRPRVR